MTKKSAVVVLPSAVTIRTCGEAAEGLLQALASADEILVVSDAVREADVSVLQVLLAARVSAQKQGKIMLLQPLGSAVQQVLERSGLAHGAEAAFWKGVA